MASSNRRDRQQQDPGRKGWQCDLRSAGPDQTAATTKRLSDSWQIIDRETGGMVKGLVRRRHAGDLERIRPFRVPGA